MTKRFGSITAAHGVLATASMLLSRLPPTPTAHYPRSRWHSKASPDLGVRQQVSGAVSITATFTGKAPPSGQTATGRPSGSSTSKPGVTIQQAAGAVNASGGDLNALTPYGSLFVSASAPATVQTVLTPGSYVALNDTGNGQPGFAPFTVTQSTSPAALPAAAATQTAIEFGFRGPACCTTGRWCGPEPRLPRAHDLPVPGSS